MSSFILPCWVNRDSGYPQAPNRPGSVKHVVRVGWNPRMPVVLEFASGGILSHVACAPACIESRLLEAGIHSDSMALIEQIAGTTLSGGTTWDGILRALANFRIPGTTDTGPCPPGYVMNPMLDAVQPMAAFPAYLAARQGGYISVPDPHVVPPPPPPPPSGAEMQTFLVKPGDPPLAIPGATTGASVNLASFVSQNITMWIYSPTGAVIGEKVLTLDGNAPNVHGPLEKSGYAYQLVGSPAENVPCLLLFDAGSAEYSVSIH